jgi:hypothetical protein
MKAIKRALRLLWDGLFMQQDAYETLRQDDNPVVEGLFIVVLVGLAVAIAVVIGTMLEWANDPSLADIQSAVLSGMQRMPWWEMMRQGGPQAMESFQNSWDAAWQAVSMMTSPLNSVAGIVGTPLGLIIGWLVFGVIAHLVARIFGGIGTLGQTLGTTSLAAAPQLLNVVGGWPYLVVAGIGTWTMLCRYTALRTTHQLSWPRAIWATILPPILIGLVAFALAAMMSILFGATLATFLGGMAQ